MPAAIATIPPVRARVMELIFETLRQYTRVSLREKAGPEVEVPAEWGGEYYPSYIPEGYKFDEVLGERSYEMSTTYRMTGRSCASVNMEKVHLPGLILRMRM